MSALLHDPGPADDMAPFDESFAVLRFDNAAFLASALFYRSFRVAFPVPREGCGLPIPTPPAAWHQYVALYRWPGERYEPIGFCNWIRYRDVYLEGGLCVEPTFYRRLPKDHWITLRQRGGVAQLMMETAAEQLNDCDAWFGYCGDKRADIVIRE